jgi:hypothetical protein
MNRSQALEVSGRHNAIAVCAIDYAKQGWPVFPCNPKTKQPYTPNGFKGATTDVNRVIDLWRSHPEAMIGMPTGSASGVWVLDIDVKSEANGAAELAKLERANGSLPNTVIVSTPSGGAHYYFTHTDGVRNRGSFEPGIDVRGEGGYVILPGSVRHDGCSYDWKSRGTGVASAPEWLLGMIMRPKATTQRTGVKSNPTYSDAAMNSELQRLIGTSKNRNNQLNDSAMVIGQFVGAGEISRSDAEERLYGAAVANGYVGKDGEAAARATIRSGLDAGERQPRDIPESDELLIDDSDWVVRWLARLREKASKKQRFDVTWFDEVNLSGVKEEILEGMLGTGEFSVIVAKPGTAKSVLAVDIGCHIAADQTWHGRKVKPGLVVFFAAERKKLTERRIAAWRKKHGVEKIPFVVVGGKLDLTTGLVDAEALAKTIQELEAKSGYSCVLIILDTVTRTFGPGDQNQSKDMGRYIQSVDALNKATGAHIAAIHHSPWSEERGKGAIDLDGAVDVSFGVTASGTGPAKQFTLTCTGSNDGEEGVITTFKLESIPLGIDDKGVETTAPVVIEAEGRKLPKSYREMAIESLEQAIKQEGLRVPDNSPGFPHSTIAVKTDIWRDRFYADCRDSDEMVTDEAVSKRYRRSVTDLTKHNKICQVGDWTWIVQPEVTLH